MDRIDCCLIRIIPGRGRWNDLELNDMLSVIYLIYLIASERTRWRGVILCQRPMDTTGFLYTQSHLRKGLGSDDVGRNKPDMLSVSHLP